VLDEIKQKIMDLLEADNALTSLLASDEAIYYQRPPQARVLPCLTYLIEDEPDVQMDGRGKAILRLCVDIWSKSADTNDAVLDALDAVLFDAHRGGALDTTNWQVKSCRRLKSEVITTGVVETEDGREVERRRTRWALLAYRKGA